MKRGNRAKGGRPAYDCVPMVKIIVLQALCNLSDGHAEFQIGDRRSFMRFLGIGMSGKVPDATTIRSGRSAVEIWPDEPAKWAQKDIDARRTV